ncbi:carnitine dehydratase [Arthrobacter sp. MYb211]|uniref:aldehyde dehydrogenase n=1 Tax=unclassified Arthrobacter TaxID=235627 RepID=UPI000CFDF9F4|nr:MULTISPECIES: aldehyde dehydrogenase [unclassified Arthrobacter]PRA03248.1 carnitine dehydratase [Arthrobacter sp. MYb229]PRA11861.1 carnitine dehydratase [Arthrobacter sp. MYb221]PRB49718.1 carnitine dehydratase [Arthrobacter sp. MYb216]PRC08216.1 carnitine dehydratase [Arthrobacter sp. MYb211]
MTERLSHFIGGEYVAPSEGSYFTSTNPATLEVLYEAARGNAQDVDRAVTAAQNTFESTAWKRMSATQRGHLLRRLGDLIGENAERLAMNESLDNGKLLREMRGQMRSLPEYFYYYAGLADKVQGSQIPTTNPDILNYTQREALGVVGAITPWNSPLTLTTSKIAPALAAGNTVVIKPSEYTSRTVLLLAELADQAGFPAGAINVVTGLGAEAGAALVSHPKLAKISFTGSTGTGSHIAAQAASRFIGCTLELGGKSPNIVFPDANVANASMGVVAGIYAAAGQTCIAGSRVFAHKSVYDELVERVTERARSIRIGDPLLDETELGPLAFADQLDKVASYVKIGAEEGATIHAGGGRPEGLELPGYYYSPTVLTDVNNDMRVVREEIFGPVAAIMPFEHEDELVSLANDTEYGLAAGVWTQNLATAHRMARRLDAGTIWVNTYRAMSPMSPRQGFKNSGVGIEHGIESMHEYTRLKSVWINTDEGPVSDPFVMRG